MITIEDKKVQESIKAGLMAYKGMAKYYLKGASGRGVAKSWKRLTLAEKTSAARALVKMAEVAKSPKDFFSIQATEAGWRASAEQFAKEHYCSVVSAYLIVLGPKELVINGVEDALQQPLRQQYANFLRLIQDYEYTEGSSKYPCAQLVMEESARICKRYESVSSNFLSNLVRKVKSSLAR